MLSKFRLSTILLLTAAFGCAGGTPLSPTRPATVTAQVSDALPASGVAKHEVTMIAAGRGFFSVKADAPLTVWITPPTCNEWTCGTISVFSADGIRRFLDVQQGDQFRIWLVSQPAPQATVRYDLEVGVIPAT